MALATTEVRVEAVGSSWMTTGKWTATAGDAAGTIDVPGQIVAGAQFSSGKTTGGPVEQAHWSWAADTNKSTVTVYPHQTVTAGRFFIISR